MERKIVSFRITDEEKKLLKAYLDKIRNQEDTEPEPEPEPEQKEQQEPQKTTEPVRDADVQKFLDTAEKWYNAMKQLVEIGTIKQIPEIFKCGYQQQVSSSGIVSGGIAELPPFVEDVLNGGTYPNPEDCTEEERAVLYDAKFKVLFKTYIQAKDDRVRMNLRQSMLATVNEILG